MKRNKLIVGIGLLLIGVFALYGFAAAQDEYVFVGTVPNDGSCSFNKPQDVEVAQDGAIYVSDTDNYRIQKFLSDGTFSKEWANLGWKPWGIAVDSVGTIYAADGDTTIYKTDMDGNFTPWLTELNKPYGVAVGPNHIYVAVTGARSILQVNPNNGNIVASLSYGDWSPHGVAVYGTGPDLKVYVVDRSQHYIYKCAGMQSIEGYPWGGYGTEDGKFISPSDVEVDADGFVYVADCDNNRMQKFNSNGSHLTTWGSEGTGDAQLSCPCGTAVDSNGVVYVADYEHCIQMFAPCGLNIAPEVGEITAPMEPILGGTTIASSATFTDDGDTHTAVWDWGDGDTCVIDEGEGSIIPAGCGTIGQGDTVTGNHTYTTAGVYVLTLTVTDGCGESDDASFQYVVVYDPAGGFVTGGGWIDSPLRAYAADPSLTGKANLGFISKYKNGATIPTGQTQFNFKAGDLNFHADSYEWLVVDSDSSKAQYKGSGTINGDGNYDFKVTVIDAAEDFFRIKIWDGDNIVYDTQMGEEDDYADPTTEIDGGSIVIHE